MTWGRGGGVKSSEKSTDVLYGWPQGARQIGKLMLICLILGRSKVVISSVEKNVGFMSTFRLDNLIC